MPILPFCPSCFARLDWNLEANDLSSTDLRSCSVCGWEDDESEKEQTQ